VAESSGDLDDDGFRGVQEVDAGDLTAIAADPMLRRRPGQVRLANERQESPFEHGFPAAVEHQLVKDPHAMTTWTAELAQAFD
jgi:hypothetical protein